MGSKERDADGYGLGKNVSVAVAAMVRERMAGRVSQADLCRMTGIPTPHVSDLLNGRRTWQRWHILRVAMALGCAESDLLPIGLRILAPAGVARFPAGLAQFLAEHGDEITYAEAEQLMGSSLGSSEIPMDETFWSEMLALKRRLAKKESRRKK